MPVQQPCMALLEQAVVWGKLWAWCDKAPSGRTLGHCGWVLGTLVTVGCWVRSAPQLPPAAWDRLHGKTKPPVTNLSACNLIWSVGGCFALQCGSCSIDPTITITYGCAKITDRRSNLSLSPDGRQSIGMEHLVQGGRPYTCIIIIQ